MHSLQQDGGRELSRAAQMGAEPERGTLRGCGQAFTAGEVESLEYKSAFYLRHITGYSHLLLAFNYWDLFVCFVVICKVSYCFCACV